MHVPSCAQPVDSDGTTREGRNAESEGALINVYTDHIEIFGVDFISGKYLPVACYSLDTTLYEVPENEDLEPVHHLRAEDFEYYKGGEGLF